MASHDNLFGVPAVELLPPSSDAWRLRRPFPVLLTCEHASAALPPSYEWGADAWLAEMHWAVDLGVRPLLDALQREVDCPAVASCFSRLFVDVNRVTPPSPALPPTPPRAAAASQRWACWRWWCSSD